MKDIKMLYAENSSIELLNKMNDSKVLQKALVDFVNDDIKLGFGNVRKWHTSEFDYKTRQIVSEGDEFLCERKLADVIITYLFTDYTFIITVKHLGDFYADVTDWSDEWISYLTTHLKGNEREKYLAGLKDFSRTIANNIQNQLLGAVKGEEYICK